jgi:glucose/arabinose dehydrogenase
MLSQNWLAAALAVLPGLALAGDVETSAGTLAITTMLEGLEEPWGIDFLPDGAFVVTEREGRLLLARDGVPNDISGLPEVFTEGQGGLLDVLVPRDFNTSREVWISFAAPVDGGGATAAGRGRLSEDGSSLTDFKTVFTGNSFTGGRHFGSRLVELSDGRIALTTGDRGTGPDGLQAQDPMISVGKVIILNRDGSPGVTQEGWMPGAYSVGHRNIQGATLDLEDRLLTVEHGAQGGDELNAPEEGLNYGWPIISYGENYGGGKIGEGSDNPGMEQPLHYWDPSIAPSGLLVYSGKLVPDWKADIFFGSLNSDFLGRLDPDTPAKTGFAEERITAPETGRVRDVVEGPDGAIWFLSVYDGAVYRMGPAE